MKTEIMIKTGAIICAIGGFIISHLGGWDKTLYALVSLMAVDYALGIMLSLVGKSTKTENGKLSPAASAVGIVKKTAALLCVYVACILDMFVCSNFVREGVIIAFCTTEMISIIENLTRLGVPIPQIFHKILDILKNKGNKR